MKIQISDDFRASMNWLHTWAGVAVSCLLFMIFWMGSLSVFDREIDQWMKPEMRVQAPNGDFSYGDMINTLSEGPAKGGASIYLRAPKEREPLGHMYYQTADGEAVFGKFDPTTREAVELTESYAGTEFFYPFHYSLHIPEGIGLWIVGFCAMAMLVLMASGIFIHRKIVKDFFTFRPKKALRRSTLDLHNMSSLMALPLHILFPLTGLMIFFTTYFPWSSAVLFEGDEAERTAQAYGSPSIVASGDPAPPLPDIDAIIAENEARWATRSAGSQPKADAVGLYLANDANAYIFMRDTFPSRAVSMNKNVTSVSVSSGEILADAQTGPAKSSFAWLVGAHYIQFDSWALRWLYFAGGLLGSLMIASGLMFWIQSRIRKVALEPRSVRVVRGLAIGSITGIILASGSYLVANRLIPANSDGFGLGRANFEVLIFYIVWLGGFAHAAIRGAFAWREQCIAIAIVAVLAVLLNWITTIHHPFASAAAGLTQIWAMDLTLLVGGAVACFAVVRLKGPAQNYDGAVSKDDAIDADALPAE